jgi:hypothetical protein
MKSRFAMAALAILVGAAACSDSVSVTAATPAVAVSDPIMPNRSLAVLSPGNYTDAWVIVDNPSSPGITDRYSYQAERTASGKIRGWFEYKTTTLSGTAKVTGDIVCFSVLGNKARLGGVITRSNSPDLPVGSELTWSVTDNYGKDSKVPDTASSLLGAPAQLYCDGGLPYPEGPVVKRDAYVYVER